MNTLYSQQVINIGSSTNDGEGDPLRTAFSKVNNNFANLFQTFVNSTLSVTTGNTPQQIIFSTPASTFTEGQFWIRSNNSTDSQSLQLFAQLSNDGSSVKFTGYGTTFFNSAYNGISNFEMNVDPISGNVQILADPLINDTITHYIASQIMYSGLVFSAPLNITTEGGVDSITTENSLVITTE